MSPGEALKLLGDLGRSEIERDKKRHPGYVGCRCRGECGVEHGGDCGIDVGFEMGGNCDGRCVSCAIPLVIARAKKRGRLARCWRALTGR